MKRLLALDSFLADIERAVEVRIIQSEEPGVIYFSEGGKFCIRPRLDMLKPLKCGGYGVLMNNRQLETTVRELEGILEVFG